MSLSSSQVCLKRLVFNIKFIFAVLLLRMAFYLNFDAKASSKPSLSVSVLKLARIRSIVAELSLFN